MLADLLEAIRRREETLTIGGVKLVVRELAKGVDVGPMEDNVDLSYKLVVRSTFDEQGNPVFTDDDIPALKGGAKLALEPLFSAVSRVHGLDLGAETKNSAAAPDSAPPTS